MPSPEHTNIPKLHSREREIFTADYYVSPSPPTSIPLPPFCPSLISHTVLWTLSTMFTYFDKYLRAGRCGFYTTALFHFRLWRIQDLHTVRSNKHIFLPGSRFVHTCALTNRIQRHKQCINNQNETKFKLDFCEYSEWSFFLWFVSSSSSLISF